MTDQGKRFALIEAMREGSPGESSFAERLTELEDAKRELWEAIMRQSRPPLPKLQLNRRREVGND